MDTLRRILDLLLGTAGLVICFPLLLICSIGVRLNSPGPVLYRQPRVGYRGRTFLIYKFRSMVRDAEEEELWVTGDEDPRITSVGRWMRRYKLDEIPQFLNVLRGEMSMVGPRPRLERYARHYPEEIRSVLFSVRPGITDPATIRAVRQERVLGRVPPEKREHYYLERILPAELRMNVEAIRNRTLGSYFRILFETVVVLAGSATGWRRTVAGEESEYPLPEP